MKYVTKHCPVCGKQFVVIREAAHKVECCTLGCLERMDCGVLPLGTGRDLMHKSYVNKHVSDI